MISTPIESEVNPPDCWASKVLGHPALEQTVSTSMRLINLVKVVEQGAAMGSPQSRAKPSPP